MTGTTLVVLAAGRGTRFGGLKQLAVVRDDGATVSDVLLERAARAGIERAVVVTSPESADGFRARGRDFTAPGLTVVPVVQPSARGTADAVLVAQREVEGSVVVVNGDDLYPADAFERVTRHLREAPEGEHAVVGFRLDRTVLGSRPESRALLEADPQERLVAVQEGRVEKEPALQFVSTTASIALRGDELVSMNMWAFRPAVFDALHAAIADRGAARESGEVYLPDVVAAMVAKGDTVRVLRSDAPCIGITYRGDLDAVRAALS